MTLFRRSRFRRTTGPVVLAISIGLNLLLAGWVTSELLLGPSPVLKPVPDPAVTAREIAKVLPAADGVRLRQEIEARQRPLNEAKQAYEVALDQLRQSLLAPIFDPAAFDQAMIAVRQSRQAERAVFTDAVRSAILEMSPAGRQAFVVKHLGGAARQP